MAAQNVFTIPASAPFGDVLAEGVIARYGRDPLALSAITIFLPTRRAARSLGDAFARVLGGSALLPEFRPLGDIDDGDLAFDAAQEALDLPPAIAPLRRRLLLATLVRRWYSNRRGEDVSFVQGLAHADGLCTLIDEIESYGADINRLDGMIGKADATHWEDVRDFLFLMKSAWPDLLRAENALDPAARRNLALGALAEKLKRETPRPIIAAGSTGSIPATAHLLATIASLPQGSVVLPGLDHTLDEDGWRGIGEDPAHPQFGLRQLLERFGVARSSIRDWVESAERNPSRERLLSEVLRPAPTTDAWRRIADGPPDAFAEGMKGLSLVEAASPSEEAAAIALMLREALAKPGRTAALVTPDRALGRRVTAELARFGVDIDDSAGQPSARTPAGAFLCLVAEAAAEHFAPIALLALLKHPLVSLGQEREVFLKNVRALDRALRGQRPDPGLDGIARRIANDDALAPWFASVADILRPLKEIAQSDRVELTALIDAHTDAAEQLSRKSDGKPRVWEKDSGAVASALFASLRVSSEALEPTEPSAYAPLFRLIAEETPVRPAYGRHPRLAILGPLEARLQGFDVTILGSLNETSWPRSVAADPWLSRPMRQEIGLESPERAVGLSAHDFASLASRPRVILTRATKADGAQTIASRWLQRLQQFAKGLGIADALAPKTDWIAIVRAMNTVGEPKRVARPAPKPPVSIRPRELSVTEIETWRRDPYAIYAKRILGLRPLDALEAPIGPLERGSIVHEALEIFVRENPGELPSDAALQLALIADRLYDEQSIPRSVRAVWAPRFAHAADWFVRRERERRATIAKSHVEIEGTITIDGPAGPFVLRGRADRIDVLRDGGGVIIDYKTGIPPSAKQVEALLAPQLPLEGAIAAAGGFTDIGKIEPAEYAYVRFSGGAEAGTWSIFSKDASTRAAEARAWLAARVARYDDAGTGYLSRAIAYRSDIEGDYDHLARVGEWIVEPSEEWDP